MKVVLKAANWVKEQLLCASYLPAHHYTADLDFIPDINQVYIYCFEDLSLDDMPTFTAEESAPASLNKFPTYTGEEHAKHRSVKVSRS